MQLDARLDAAVGSGRTLQFIQYSQSKIEKNNLLLHHHKNPPSINALSTPNFNLIHYPIHEVKLMIPIYFKNSCAKTCLGEIKFKYAH
jgi:hypothetical protein